MIRSILIVCVGNICRSPAAEKLFRHKLSGRFTVSSAGLGAVIDHAIDPNMQRCLVNAGVTELTHRARQFTVEMAQQADLIMAMEKAHIHQIVQTASHTHGKTMLLGRWASNAEVPDPYQRDKAFFTQVYCAIDRYVDEWVLRLA